MQTFLPYDDFTKSLSVLDNKRLGKQRVEASQILNALSGKTKGWVNHPATKMWRGYESALILYRNLSIIEWIRRGFNNTMPFFSSPGGGLLFSPNAVIMPGWFGNKDFHASHRSNLLRKDPSYYGKFGWDESSDLPYIWPS